MVGKTMSESLRVTANILRLKYKCGQRAASISMIAVVISTSAVALRRCIRGLRTAAVLRDCAAAKHGDGHCANA